MALQYMIQTITPELASYYLTKNTNNYRKLNKNVVRMYADDMISGRWKQNGEAIKFNKNGDLIDGQHRLSSIIKANIPVEMAVIFGIDNDVIEFDMNKVRTARDMALQLNLSNGAVDNVSLGAAKMLIAYTKKTNTKYDVSKTEIVNFAKYIEDDLCSALSIIRKKSTQPIAKKCIIQAVVVIFLHYNVFQPDLLSDFFGCVNSGFAKDGYNCTPAIVFRNYILSWKRVLSKDERELVISMLYDSISDFSENVTRIRRYNKKPENVRNFIEYCDDLINEYLESCDS